MLHVHELHVIAGMRLQEVFTEQRELYTRVRAAEYVAWMRRGLGGRDPALAWSSFQQQPLVERGCRKTKAQPMTALQVET